MFDAVHSKVQTFRVDIYIALKGTLAEFLETLAEYGSPRIVSYEPALDSPLLGYRSPTMVLEFTSYEDALGFAQRWFGQSAENAKEYVETITV